MKKLIILKIWQFILLIFLVAVIWVCVGYMGGRYQTQSETSYFPVIVTTNSTELMNEGYITPGKVTK